ncbi:MAG: dihydroorotase [Peptococcaceae bacterium]|mgnify:CR=1 FL=1|jgi:dihydroorotase|nr:dihydroorotase [Peptococcaceae bacterium]
MLLRNGHLVDPSQAIDGVTDIRIENGVVSEVGPDLPEQDGEEIFDLSGCYVMPGLIDTHVHLRDPGQEESEDLESGSKAAIAGGFTTVVAMPNTFPVVDNVPIVRYIKDKSARLGYADVLPTAAITKGQEGQEITEIGFLRDAGVIAFTEDGKSVANSGILRKAMTYSKPYDVLFMSHCEDKDLKGAGCMNAGALATEMGLGGIANEVEDIIIMRDIMLAKMTGVRLHIQHLSTASGLELVREAKAKGLPVTCEVTPHHLFLTEDAVRGYNTDAKVAPPLRTAADNEALINGLKDGTITCIGTDHAPHSSDKKDVEFERAANGISSIEIAFPLIWTHLVETGRFTLSEIVSIMSCNPAELLRIDRGSLSVGKVADVLIFDPETERAVNPQEFYSKGKNCPYTGEVLRGWPSMVLRAGRVVLKNGAIV